MIVQKQTLKFLQQLENNNNKPWFEANRKTYETAKTNFLDFNAALIKKMEKIDPALSGLDPKKTTFRINRDVRFSKNKSPYKNNMGTTLNKGGKKMLTSGYYFHMQPGNKSFAAAGSYLPEPELLQNIRQEIDYNFAEFKKILNSASFKKFYTDLDAGDKLKTVPKGYSADNPAIEYLKNKSFTVSKIFTDKEVLSEDFLNTLTAAFKSAYTFIQFLNKPIND